MNDNCCKCNKPIESGKFIFTENGDMCDECANVKRDRNGHFWLPDETEHVYGWPGQETYTVTREQAFGT